MPSLIKRLVQLEIEINGRKAGKTYRELKRDARNLNTELNQLVPGTEAFKKKAAELKSVNTRLQKIRKDTGGVRRGMDGLASSVGALKGLFLGFIALDKVGDLIRYSTQLSTVQSKFNTVFGEAGAIVEAYAERNAIALGLTTNEYKRLNAEIGDLLIPMQFTREEAAKMSTDLVGLSGALSAWTGGTKTQAEVSDILRKAILGEREQLKTLGISIQEADVKTRLLAKGQDKLTGTSLQQAKALATMELIFEKTTDAQAAFAKGGEDSVQIRARVIAKIKETAENILQRLLPAFNAALRLVEFLIDSGGRFILTLAAIPRFIKENRIAIAALVIGLVAFNSNTIAAAANTLRLSAAQKVQAVSQKAAIFSFKALNTVMKANPIGLIVTAIALLVSGFDILYRKSQTVRAGIAGLGAVAKEIFTIVKESIASFVEGFNDIKEGNIREGLKKMGQAIVNTNPIGIAFTQGERLGNAFTEGYQNKIETDAAAAQAEALAKEANSLNAAAYDSGKQSGKAFGEGVLDGRNEALSAESAENKADKEKRPTAGATKKDDTEATGLGIADFQVLSVKAAVAAAKKRLEVLEQSGARELDEIEKKFLTQLLSEQEFEELSLAQKVTNFENRLALLTELGLTETEAFRQTELEKLRIQKELNEKRTENEKRTAEVKAEIQAESLGIAQGFLGSAIELLGAEEEARKKNASAIKAFESAKVFVNWQAELSEIFKTYAALGPFGQAAAIARAAIATARSIASIKKITSKKFYYGGFTGNDGIYTDSEGRQVAGVVHTKEWVASDYLTQNPQYRPWIDWLESVQRNRGGYQDGGFTDTDLSPTGVSDVSIQQGTQGAVFDRLSQQMDTLIGVTAEEKTRPAQVSYFDLADTDTEYKSLEAGANL